MPGGEQGDRVWILNGDGRAARPQVLAVTRIIRRNAVSAGYSDREAIVSAVSAAESTAALSH